MTRPGLSASRSVTSHEVVAPVALLRTLTHVPLGSTGLAHCPGFQAYHVASPVALEVAGACVVVVTDWTTLTGAEDVATADGELELARGATVVEGAVTGTVVGAGPF